MIRPALRQIHKQSLQRAQSGSVLPLSHQTSSRSYSSRPPLEEVIPKKGTLRTYLFQHKVPLSYADVVSTYRSCYEDGANVPKKVTGEDLLTLQKILASHRKQTRTISPHGLALEHTVLETAAEMGSHMAIATLAGEILTGTAKYEQAKAAGDSSAIELEYTHDDIEHAQKLLMELSQNNFPLALKISGDVAFLVGKIDKASELYTRCADLLAGDSSAVAAGIQAECFRGIGIVAFQNFSLAEARLAFDNCIVMGGAKEHPDVHFYLGQMASEVRDVPRARFHLREAASKGFFDSFAPLGNLELYYYNDPVMAHHWFSLGAEMSEPTCLAGLFDVAMKQSRYTSAEGYRDRILASGNEQFIESFKKSRHDLLDELAAEEQKTAQELRETQAESSLWK